ncbi:HAD family phosphatase [Streptomyces triticirhizae]|uniref:HAD family phosphatase n=1 Tax=Streptomyces triticirhizae TaxID=2483353 RepID=A0A3M2LUX1_9ACTN|nr:HAD family phosphatase [Streptomyces triticirhizae]
MPFTTVVVDYGGVLTNPLSETFDAFARQVGISSDALATAFLAATERHGQTPMAALEVGAITERQMVERVAAELPPGDDEALAVLGERPFGELWFAGRTPNEPFLLFLRKIAAEGHRLALLTNNVREWRPRWRAQLPVDELFSVVVDSHEEGVRKPDPRIYRILLERLGASPQECLFVDDTKENCDAAESLGIRSVLFTDTDSAIDQLTEALRTPLINSPGGTR